MDKCTLVLLKILKHHKNFSLDLKKLKIYHNSKNDSSYNDIKEIVSITQELNSSGIKHQVFDGYIQAQI